MHAVVGLRLGDRENFYAFAPSSSFRVMPLFVNERYSSICFRNLSRCSSVKNPPNIPSVISSSRSLDSAPNSVSRFKFETACWPCSATLVSSRSSSTGPNLALRTSALVNCSMILRMCLRKRKITISVTRGHERTFIHSSIDGYTSGLNVTQRSSQLILYRIGRPNSESVGLVYCKSFLIGTNSISTPSPMSYSTRSSPL